MEDVKWFYTETLKCLLCETVRYISATDKSLVGLKQKGTDFKGRG